MSTTNASPMIDRLLSPGEVAERLAISERAVYRLLRSAALRSHRIGSLWRISMADLDAYLDQTLYVPTLPAQRDKRVNHQVRVLPRQGDAPTF